LNNFTDSSISNFIGKSILGNSRKNSKNKSKIPRKFEIFRRKNKPIQTKTLPAIFFFQIKLKNINYPLSEKEKTGNNKIKIKIKKLG
jgi:hypothetical protein